MMKPFYLKKGDIMQLNIRKPLTDLNKKYPLEKPKCFGLYEVKKVRSNLIKFSNIEILSCQFLWRLSFFMANCPGLCCRSLSWAVINTLASVRHPGLIENSSVPALRNCRGKAVFPIR